MFEYRYLQSYHQWPFPPFLTLPVFPQHPTVVTPEPTTNVAPVTPFGSRTNVPCNHVSEWRHERHTVWN